MIRRHPHVFSGVTFENEEEQKASWEKIKAEDRAQKKTSKAKSELDDISAALPALSRARKLQHRARQVGFDWPDHQGAMEKLDEELLELKHAIDSGDIAHMEEELGDLMFVCVNVARLLNLDAESALRRSNAKFEARFRLMEELARKENQSLHDYNLEKLDQFWEQAKSILNSR